MSIQGDYILFQNQFGNIKNKTTIEIEDIWIEIDDQVLEKWKCEFCFSKISNFVSKISNFASGISKFVSEISN